MKTLKFVATQLALNAALIVLLGGLSGHALAQPAAGSASDSKSTFRSVAQRTAEHPELRTRQQLITQNFWDFDAYRQRRHREIEAKRRARAATREAERELREEQRRKARAEVRERERQYREEHIKGIPGLQEHRRRYAQELERRRQAAERRRFERWQQDDAKVVAE